MERTSFGNEPSEAGASDPAAPDRPLTHDRIRELDRLFRSSDPALLRRLKSDPSLARDLQRYDEHLDRRGRLMLLGLAFCFAVSAAVGIYLTMSI